MADAKQSTKSAEEEIARIIKAGEPGVQSAIKVLEVADYYYHAAISHTAAPAFTTRAVSHS